MEYYKNLSLEDLFYINNDGLVCCEEWKDITGYDGIYQLSNLCRVKSLKRDIKYKDGRTRIAKECILRQFINNSLGHLCVSLYKKKKKKTYGVHVIVAIIYVPNPLKLKLVEHLNDNPLDNRPKNLKWSTQKDNIINAFKRGRMNTSKGEHHCKSKFTEQQVLEIRESNMRTCELAKLYNATSTHISKIRLRRSWKHI